MINLTAIVLAAALSAHPPCWADGHNQHRNRTALRQFKKANPCPGGPDRGSTRTCKGFDIDHVCPLACCGLDETRNMQWLEHSRNLAKSSDCSACTRQNVQRGRYPELEAYLKATGHR